MGLWLGEDVGDLSFGGDLMDSEVAASNMTTEMIQANGEVFGARSQLWLHGNFDARGIVFEDLAANCWFDKWN